ncbi:MULTISPECIES: MaoC/PaaZ C-terminal domain-containing protein [Rhizobium/Agrobacterium group]|uniref:MaoC/PaaZ C-terminal domain-containing protein n=1 Tax=Rhizobium/Agrobacterium group TaxID=227290 RepID=UPI000AEBFF0F|nr:MULTISPECIES: MaoC/PaaZ C-terminal domain-containing protein [Rhizobium/Agrobacterium group]MDH1270427.1 MaoC/PaaZ C-terminal domain-containing protein [Agrobacterium pusense]
MIDYEKLMAYDIPEVCQSYGPRECAFYALSIGVGQDPMDLGDLQFVGAGALAPFPTLPLVLGHPGFWLANPDTGVDALRLVHGEQGITLHAPLPPNGMVIGKTRVTGIVDKGAGRGALLYTEKELRDADDGRLYATTRSTIFLRGDGGFGGPSGPVKKIHTLPETAPAIVHKTQSRPEQALWYRWNGDDNPLHIDPDVAAKAGFERPILHGLCTLGMAAHALLKTLCAGDPTRLQGLDARFSATVVPGETLLTEIWRDGSFRVRAAERDMVVLGNGLAQFE